MLSLLVFTIKYFYKTLIIFLKTQFLGFKTPFHLFWGSQDPLFFNSPKIILKPNLRNWVSVRTTWPPWLSCEVKQLSLVDVMTSQLGRRVGSGPAHARSTNLGYLDSYIQAKDIGPDQRSGQNVN